MVNSSFLQKIKEHVESWIYGFRGGHSMQPPSERAPNQIFPDEITAEIKEAARSATDIETHMKKWVAIKAWLPGVFFAMFMSMACIMEGYGLVLITGFFASPRFKRDFGCPVTPDQDFDCEIPTAWQTGLVDGALGGQVIGIILNGWLTEKYGYRRTFLAATIAITGFFAITFLANSLWVLLIGFILCGIPWGIFQTLTTSYASDVCPTPIRAYFTMWTNLCWVLGQLMGASVQRGLLTATSKWSYKAPFLIQWVFPLPIIIAAFAAPESPWWLIRQGRHQDAYTAMRKLQIKQDTPPEYSIDNHMAMLFVTNKEEADMTTGGKTGYMDCFGGVNRRRTINTCAVWSIQNACGAALMQFSTYFFLQAGLPPEWAFTCTMVQYGNGIVGTVISWILITKIGRRSLFLSGLVILMTLLIAIGTVSTLSIRSDKAAIMVGTLLMVFTLAYNCTIGPVTYSLVTELPSTRLKSKTINLARTCYLSVGLLNGAITPLMLNPESLNWGAKTAWFWAGVTLACTVYTYFEVPEPKNLTYGQIDYLYVRKVSARRFKSEGDELRFATSQPGSPHSGEGPLSTAIEFNELSRAILIANSVASAPLDAAADIAARSMPLSPSDVSQTSISPFHPSDVTELPLPTSSSAIGTLPESHLGTPSVEAAISATLGDAHPSDINQEEDFAQQHPQVPGEAEARPRRCWGTSEVRF